MLKLFQHACVCAALCMLHASGAHAAGQGADGPVALALEDFSLEQLSGIARSGATTLPEALRLAPGVQLAFAGALRATAGLRLQHNDHAGMEVLPSRRLGWHHAAGALPWAAASPGYHELDVRIAWQARPDTAPALSGRNPLHARHPEAGTAGMRQLAEHLVFASAALRF